MVISWTYNLIRPWNEWTKCQLELQLQLVRSFRFRTGCGFFNEWANVPVCVCVCVCPVSDFWMSQLWCVGLFVSTPISRDIWWMAPAPGYHPEETSPPLCPWLRPAPLPFHNSFNSFHSTSHSFFPFAIQIPSSDDLIEYKTRSANLGLVSSSWFFSIAEIKKIVIDSCS